MFPVEVCGSGFTASADSAGITDPRASPNALKLYEYLRELKTLPEKRFLSGQHIHQEWKYVDYCLVRLFANTGEWPALLHSQADYPWKPGWKYHHSFHFIYPLFYNHYHYGGILMLLLNPVCPWNGGTLKQDVPPGDTIASVYTPGTHVNRAYTEYLQVFGDGLRLFQRDDIPVIIRLFGENNGNWFWFHHGNEQVSAEAFRKLYTYTVDYLRDTLGLHNLLFCYEVSDHLYGGSGKRAWYTDGLVLEKTDILGIQCYYNFNPGKVAKTLDLYRIYDSIGKPIMMPQYIRDSEKADIDWVSFLDIMKRYNENIIGFSPWADGPGASKWGSLAANVNAELFMKDPWTINRGEVTDFPARDFIPLDVPRTESDGIRNMSKGRTVYNFSHGNEGFTVGTFNGVPVFADTSLIARNNKLECFFYVYEDVLAGGESAFIMSPFDRLDPSKYAMPADRNNIMKIRLRNHSTSGRMVLAWKEAGTVSWPAENIREFEVERNGLDFMEYTLDLGDHPAWRDTITQFRLYLGPESVLGSTEIDYIAFGTREDFGIALTSGSGCAGLPLVFPNPSSGRIWIKGLTERSGYEIFTISGERVMSGELDYESCISMDNWHPGMYILRLNTRKEAPLIFKLTGK